MHAGPDTAYTVHFLHTLLEVLFQAADAHHEVRHFFHDGAPRHFVAACSTLCVVLVLALLP